MPPVRAEPKSTVPTTNETNESPEGNSASGNLRIGAVRYLNSKPLLAGLDETASGRLVLDVPSRLAARLSGGELDVALIPSIEVIRSERNYAIVSDACVAAHGPVRSVKAYFRKSPGAVRTLALDEGSRTSATLLQIMLRQRFGTRAQVETLSLGRGIEETKTDAVLIIGDRAIKPASQAFEEVWDLGEQWQQWTGLPFVFAAWAAPRLVRRRSETSQPASPNPKPQFPNPKLATIDETLSRARDRGLADLEQIISREADALALDRGLVREYFTQNLHFTLGPAEKSALKLFAQLAAESDLAPSGGDLVYHDRAAG